MIAVTTPAVRVADAVAPVPAPPEIVTVGSDEYPVPPAVTVIVLHAVVLSSHDCIVA